MYAEVIIDYSNSEIDRIFDYHIPSNMELMAGERVKIPFGKQVCEGFVINIKENTDVPQDKIKSILEVIDIKPLILEEHLKLMNYMCENYNLRKVDVLRLFIPSELRTGKVRDLIEQYCVVNSEIDLIDYQSKIRKNAKNQLDLFEYISKNSISKKSYLVEKFSSTAVNKFIQDNILIIKIENINREPESIKTEKKNIVLTVNQNLAIEKITSSIDTFVLYGVTGSGKTEVYMSVIEKCLQNGKNAILLVPEISLTPQVYSVFLSRFGNKVAILHSGLSSGERYDEWKRIRFGQAKIVVGARSAIFAPISNVGIIIIDEEHDSSYFSEANPRYYTHDIAEFRRKYNNCSLVLGSATPDLNSFYLTTTNKYKLVQLPTRVNNKELPKIQIVDMLSEIRNGNTTMFSSVLIEELRKCIEDKKQAMIFLNRRGFSSFVRCRDCGYIAKCSDCDISLVYHKFENKLKCHYCGKQFRPLTKCPECGSEYLRYGAIGTQQVVEELNVLFPNVKILRMDNDTTNYKNAHLKILDEFGKTKPCILVGTQMIAKGHDFKDVTLVGIVDADQSLYQADYRSAERTFQLIAQVSGRAGRDKYEGKVVLQTYAPKHYVYKFVANYNYLQFFEKEINIREITKFPPFTEILRILISSQKEEISQEITKLCFQEIKKLEQENKDKIVYLGAMKSPVKKIKNMFRYQIIVRVQDKDKLEIRKKIYQICNENKNKNINMFIEINPQNLM